MQLILDTEIIGKHGLEAAAVFSVLLRISHRYNCNNKIYDSEFFIADSEEIQGWTYLDYKEQEKALNALARGGLIEIKIVTETDNMYFRIN